MKECTWEVISDFSSAREFNEFERWIKQQISVGQAKEVVVEKMYMDMPAFIEKWYEDTASQKIWRLVYPDYPFTGLFEPVS